MKIFIDIGHPAHVHYFKNFIKIMEGKGHEVLITARDREVIHDLLDAENIPYINRGKGAKTLYGKILYTIKTDLLLLWHALKFKPDIFLSHGPFYAFHVSLIIRKPCISTGDSDHINASRMLMKLVSSYLTPDVYRKSYGINHFKFKAYMELLYLHSNYFSYDDVLIRSTLGVEKDERYFVLRFVSWNAFHDVGQGGISSEIKENLISLLSQYGKVFISSEGELPEKFEKYKVTFPPEMLHGVLAEADICISEGATTGSEAAILGTPTIYVNSLEVSYCKEQEEKYGLSTCLKDGSGLLGKVKELLEDPQIKQKHLNKRNELMNDKIDPTAFLVWFIENYPKSEVILKEDINYQQRFR